MAPYSTLTASGLAALHVIRFGRADTHRFCRLSPCPACDLRHVVTVHGDVLPVLDELVVNGLLGIGGPCAKFRDPVDHVAHQMEAVELVEHAHVERRAGGTLLLVAAHVEVGVTVATLGRAVDERWI